MFAECCKKQLFFGAINKFRELGRSAVSGQSKTLMELPVSVNAVGIKAVTEHSFPAKRSILVQQSSIRRFRCFVCMYVCMLFWQETKF